MYCTIARPSLLHWVRWFESTSSQPISIGPFLRVCYHLRLSLPSGLFPFGFQQKVLYIYLHNNMVLHPRCVFINYNWVNQLSNTTIWWLDIYCLLHKYELHVSVLMAIFRLIDWQQTCKQLYFGMRLVYGGGGLGFDGGTRSRVCWVGRVMWVHGYYCADRPRPVGTIVQ